MMDDTTTWAEEKQYLDTDETNDTSQNTEEIFKPNEDELEKLTESEKRKL
jgi:hypothetical protein